MGEELTLLDICLLETYQVVVCDNADTQCSDPLFWGSGFIFEYKGKHFFITADHVINYDDYKIGKRTLKEVNVFLPTNKVAKGLIASLVNTLPVFSYFNKFSFDNDKSAELVDCAICLLNNGLKSPVLTKNFVDKDGKILFVSGREKLLIRQDAISSPTISKTYFVVGEVKNKMSGVVMESEFVLHTDIRYVKEEEGFYVFNTNNIVIEDEWSGLSGAPFFDDTGGLVGMLTNAKVGYHSIRVLPLKRIITLIEYVIADESK